MKNQTEQQHTPGPWHIVSSANPVEKTIMFTFGGFADNRDNGPVARTDTSSYPEEQRAHMARANACLIAAAPDLLAALEKLIGDVRDIHDIDTIRFDDVLNARAAIAKAKGGAR